MPSGSAQRAERSSGSTATLVIGHVDALVNADLCDETSTAHTRFREIVERHGDIDVLYNNAGPLDPQDHGVEVNTIEHMGTLPTRHWSSPSS
jgi:NAD(P)-dependent dehydrogenase (short-subunit alcohol dehydrogenase family)